MKQASQLLIRTITTIIAGIPIVACTVMGGVFFLILIITLTMLSINEFYYMAEKKTRNYSIGVFANAIAVALVSSTFFIETNFIWDKLIAAIIAIFLVGFWTRELFTKKLTFITNELMMALRAVLYIGVSYAYLILIRESNNGVGLYWMFFLITAIWMNDGMAYIFGIRLGRHKLQPEISPKKSIEGSIFGLFFCSLWSLFIGQVMGIPVIHSITLGILVSILAQAGDLTESLLKREMKVKDSGSLLPGHGGVLDRMDSFILTAPVVYYYTVYFNLI
ncbi:MAG: phosphatidate cytidylyltransferase [Candidatus Margulisiibacteriota bacterium]